MSELDSICDFVLDSKDEADFNFRFNHLINVAVILFETEIGSENHLPFNSHLFITKLNEKINLIIDRLNDSQLLFIDGYIVPDIILFFLMDEYPEYYHNLMYQTHYRSN